MDEVYEVRSVRREYRLDGHCSSCAGPIFPALVEETDGAVNVAWFCDHCATVQLLARE